MGKEESGLRKILIVEDDKVLNKTLAYNLTADGYEVSSAYSFQDAVRLYHVMQETRHKVEEEKAELQSLVSDISHQTKTPIANLKMLNDTMLTIKISEETREEFLHATASQLDKLDFLIQGMVKTSRLETGVITLEKKETGFTDLPKKMFLYWKKT